MNPDRDATTCSFYTHVRQSFASRNSAAANSPRASRFEFNLTLQFCPIDIRDADRREEAFLPLGDQTECGNLKFVEPECFLRVQEYLTPGWIVGGCGSRLILPADKEYVTREGWLEVDWNQ